jgi:hypothetical protein
VTQDFLFYARGIPLVMSKTANHILKYKMEKDKIDIISAKYELTEWNLVSNLYEVM